ncbi:hypothetical protein, partial [Bilophila wadsworthia]|uniref:hypothetical protein n=1 Tax=Bilophila wadsworthia TaxID=35833 RepID=UPI002671E243
GGRFLKKAPSPVPPPSKTSTGGEAARQESHLLEKGKELFSEIFPSAVRFVQRCPTRNRLSDFYLP